jgi:hypothetical protein
MLKNLPGKIWGWVACFFFIPLTFLILIVGWDTFYHPGSRFSSFPIDPSWALFFGVLFAILPLLAVWFRGRLLLGLIGFAVLGLGLLPSLFSPSAYALLVSIWLGLVAYLVGDRLLLILKLPPLPRVDHLALALAAGYASLTLISTILGFSGLYYSWLVWGILVGLTLFLLPEKLFWLWKVRNSNWRDWVRSPKDWRLIAWGLGASLICGLGAYLWALAPAVRWDSLSYHIPVPVLAIQQHAIAEIPESIQSYWAHYAETLYTLGMLIEPSTALPGLLHFQMGMLTTLFTFCLGRKLNGNTLQGILAALLFWSLPMVQVEAGSAYIDLFVSEWIAATLYCAWIWYERQTDRWLILTGIFAGLAIGTKLSSVFLIFGIGLWVIIQLIRAKHNYRFGLKKLFLFGFCVVLFAAPWFIRDWTWTGNPIFPNYNQFFTGAKTVENNNLSFEFRPTPNKFLEIVTLPQNLLFSSSIYYHELPGFALGGLSLFALPWLYPWLSRREKRSSVLALTAFAVLSIGLSIQVSANFRYLIPVFPVLCILAAENFLLLWETLQPNRLRRVVLITVIGLGAIYLISTQLVLIVRHGEIAERYPYRYVLGRETQDAFLSRAVFNYDAYRFMEKRIPPPLKILSIGNELRLYTSAKIYAPLFSSEARYLLRNISSSAELFRQLKLLNYTHLILYPPEIPQRPEIYTSPALDNEFFYRYTRPIYTHNQLTVYELIEPPGADSVSNNLLSNPGFEALIPSGLPADWELYGELSVSSDGQHAHIGQTAICVSGPSLGASFQNVQVLPGQIYTAGYWAKPEEENQVLQVYVQWLDRDKKQFAQSAEWVNLKPGWNQYQRPFVAPDNTAYARFVVSTSTPGKTWFDDLCLTTAGACR